MDLANKGPAEGWVTPQSAYIHIPFCRHRCGYCNFSVVANRNDLINRFIEAISIELRALKRPSLQTLFLGGGTPTHLPNRELRLLIQRIRDSFDLSHLDEFSVEANPEDIEESKLEILAEAGVNRISLGVQSFQPSKLEVLQRTHSPEKAIAAIEQAATYFPNISIDLIFAAPNESSSQWLADLETAFNLPIRHLSTYALTFEKGTQFWTAQHQGKIKPIDESVEVEMYKNTQRLCGANGFSHYEVSNFCKPNSKCQHNMAYWKGEGWYAAGPGAARFVDGVREVNHRSTTTYVRRIEQGESPTAEHESISLTQYTKERAAFGIRLLEGFNIEALNQHVGFDTHQFLQHAIERSIHDGLLSLKENHLKLSEKGILFADTVAQRLLD